MTVSGTMMCLHTREGHDGRWGNAPMHMHTHQPLIGDCVRAGYWCIVRVIVLSIVAGHWCGKLAIGAGHCAPLQIAWVLLLSWH